LISNLNLNPKQAQAVNTPTKYHQTNKRMSTTTTVTITSNENKTAASSSTGASSSIVRANIAPSLLSADFGHLADEAKRMIDSGADTLHGMLLVAHSFTCLIFIFILCVCFF
jgi:carbohydrate-binding DOMON domain-containing protein